jgi:hypothetical protein
MGGPHAHGGTWLVDPRADLRPRCVAGTARIPEDLLSEISQRYPSSESSAAVSVAMAEFAGKRNR